MFSIGEKVRVLKTGVAGTAVTVYDGTHQYLSEYDSAVEVKTNKWTQGWYLASELTVVEN